MSTSYWQSALDRRLSRRSALITLGAGAGGAAFLAACGGSSSTKKQGNTDKSGLLVKPVDTSKQAKRRGTLVRTATADPASLDAHLSGATVALFFEMAYSRLFNFKSGYLEPSQDEIEGGIAESWEWSPDRLQLTAKLRSDVKFHNMAPTNGRAMDVQDVLYSWKRFSEMGSNRTTAVNSANPDAPVLSLTALDSKTIVVKFKEPLVYVQSYLAQRGYLNIVPKEAENPQVLDLRSAMVGTGPFMLSQYRPSSNLTFKRHEGYWEQDRPYINQIEYPIVPEYAAGVSQFRAGNVHTYAVRQDEVLRTKRELPQLNMYNSEVNIDSTRMFWGFQAANLRDKRVRQAFSMAIDRDAWIDAQYNTAAFESEGLVVEKRWNTSLQATEITTGWWLDPKGKDFGPNAKFYKHDVAEAKKLLAAAGFADGTEITSNHFTSAQYGSEFPRLVELWEGMASESGMRFKKNLLNYNSEFLPNIRDSRGAFSGISYKTGPPAPTSDSVDRLAYEFSKASSVGYYGFDVAGKGDASGDPYVEDQLKKAKADFDTERRRKIVHDLQRYLAEAQYCIRWPGGATTFDLVWPALQNYRVFLPGSNSSNQVSALTWWLDETKAPFNKA